MTQHTISTRKYAELLWQYTKRGIVARYKGSYLGFLWPILTPLLMLGLYVFVFGYVFGGSFNVIPNESKLEYALALFVGLSLVQFIGEVLGTAPRSVVGAPNLVKKVVFPLSILPVSQVGVALFNYLISMALCLVGIAVLGNGLKLTVLYWPIILIPVVIMSLGIAFFLGALGVFLRDVAQLTGFLSMVIMYASAVFFPVSAVRTTEFWRILKYNPILHAIELSREVTVWDMPPTMHILLFVYASSIGCIVIGWLFFRKLQPTFADVL